MTDAKTDKPFNPFDAMRSMRDASVEAWAKMMTDMVNTEAYAQSAGAVLDAYLTTSAPFHDAMQKGITQALEQVNLPSRADIISLSERLTHVEKMLDDLDAKLDRVLAAKSAVQPPPSKAAPKTIRKEEDK
jgi:hypothetical protein